jgi:hypothetical protein
MNRTYGFAYKNWSKQIRPFIAVLLYFTFLEIKTDFLYIRVSNYNLYEGGQMTENESTKDVVVTDIRMPLGAMMSFMLKLAIAAIPAALLLTLAVYLFSLYVFSMFHG